VRLKERALNRETREPRRNCCATSDLVAGIKNPYVRFHKLDKPPVTSLPTTLWDYPSQHYGRGEQGSQNYRGATPSYVIWNVLTKWSQPGALIVDPFCGSGTTLDVCKDLGRKGRGFDVAPFREDIEQADARAMPLTDGCVDLVFFDPPYADNLAYSDDPRCIGKLPASDGSWGRAMDEVVRESARVLRPGGVLAMFVCDQLKVEKGRHTFAPLGLQLAMLAEEAGFSMIEHVAVVRHGKALERGPGRLHAEANDFMLRGFSHLVVFEKRGGSAQRPTRAPDRAPPRQERGFERTSRAPERGERGPPRGGRGDGRVNGRGDARGGARGDPRGGPRGEPRGAPRDEPRGGPRDEPRGGGPRGGGPRGGGPRGGGPRGGGPRGKPRSR
jgi:adenine-specific DNA-methyltransferase